MTQKDADKLKALYELYEQPMYRIAFAVLHSSEAAEDAVSEAFVRLIGHLDKLDSAESEKTKKYIVKVIKSTAVSEYRRLKKRYEHETVCDSSVMLVPDKAEDVEASADKHCFAEGSELLADMSETDRIIVLLRCEQELSWREVGEKLSVSEEYARKRFERIKKKITSTKGEMLHEKYGFPQK